MKKRIAVIGGGASGVSLLWSLASQDQSFAETETTLFHDEPQVGGHSATIGVWFDEDGKGHVAAPGSSGKIYPVDIGVQFVCSTLYPNLYKQLERPEMHNAVRLTRHEALRLSGAFNDELVWGNFPDYQGGRFDVCFDPETRELAKKFERDVHWSLLEHAAGKSVFSMTVGEYLQAKGYDQHANFFRYLLVPYLSIINGYGTSDLLETTIEDLFPIFTKIPLVQEAGPYASFLKPGQGWDRFSDGASAWVRAMADYAVLRGSKINVSSFVVAIYPSGDQVTVEWIEAAQLDDLKAGKSVPRQSQIFDEVVLTTDMTTNRAILSDARNSNWGVQSGFISEQKFELLPGICYIHQDESVLAPSLKDGKEDGQFTGYYSWGKTSPENPFDLPYDLATSYQTYFMQNILGTPHPCYVSMYAEHSASKTPAADKTIHVKTWRHGRWVASFFGSAKKELHEIQGLGHVWFAGNNTTVDSEEGALVSGMVMAEKLSSFQYPFSVLSEAFVLYKYFKDTMFPRYTLARHYGRKLATVASEA
jgi:predicted NAD/FAD-binding protein